MELRGDLHGVYDNVGRRSSTMFSHRATRHRRVKECQIETLSRNESRMHLEKLDISIDIMSPRHKGR